MYFVEIIFANYMVLNVFTKFPQNSYPNQFFNELITAKKLFSKVLL